jgi:undecaprenyl-diphosphatase
MTNPKDQTPQSPETRSTHTNPADEQSRSNLTGAPSPEMQAEAAPEKYTLQEALRQIETPEQARRVVEAMLSAVEQDITTEEVRQQESDEEPRMDRVRQAAAALEKSDIAQIILEASKEVATTSGETREALERSFVDVTNPEQQGIVEPDLLRPLDLLRTELLKHMRPLQSVDARVFLAINHLPHTTWSNQAMYSITSVMNGGWGWVLGLLAASMVDKKRGRRALRDVVPPLWFATMTVEYPVKSYFRRRRPFIDVVQAIAVGRKPGNYSFPSGHSASAFAGAWLLQRHYPGMAPLWYSIAGVVAFSRIYLGAHYPGDVLTGAVAGVAIAETARRVIDSTEENGES